MLILILTRQAFLWKDVIIQVWRLSTMEISCTWTIPSMHYPIFSMCTLQICVLKSGVLKKLFILCEHGTNVNIGGVKMANNRHAVNRNFLQSYWTSLYNSHPACEETDPNCERLFKIQKITCNVVAWKQGTASLGRTDAIRNQPYFEKTMVTKSTSVNKNSEEQFEISRTEVKESK